MPSFLLGQCDRITNIGIGDCHLLEGYDGFIVLIALIIFAPLIGLYFESIKKWIESK